MDSIDLLYLGQVRAVKPKAPSIRQHQGRMKRELWTHGRAKGSIPAAPAASVTSYYYDSDVKTYYRICYIVKWLFQ